MSAALLDYLRRSFDLPEAAAPVLERLFEAWKQGHTGVKLDAFERAALGKGPALALDVDAAVPRPLVLRNGLLQSRQHAAAERELAQGLMALAGRPRSVPGPAAAAALARLYPDPGDPQAKAVRLGLESGLALITGGPGTGKTYTAARLLALLLEDRPGLRFALAAPTGKAAQRLGESVAKASDDPALRAAAPRGAALLARASGSSGTLHRLLEWRPGEDACARNADRPLEADLVIADEASMLDLLLWRALLRALPSGCRLVVLGDPLQLESIEPGRVLGALVSASAPGGTLAGCAAALTRNHRFERHPGIGALAAAARDHDPQALLAAAPLGASAGAEVARLDTERPGALAAALDRVWPAVLDLARSPGADGALTNLERLRILCAVNEGPWGVDELNARVQARLAAEGLAQAALPVLVTVNDPHSGLFNGDLGVLLPGPDGGRAVFPGPGGHRSYPASQLPDSRPAWAISVHRSQGSEYATVVLVLPPAARGLRDPVGPELLYTAVTRAQERVVLVASQEALVRACEARPGRVTGLSGWMV